MTLLLLSVTLLPSAYEQNFLSFPSEKSRIMKAPQGHPNLFLQYHHDIRANEHGQVEYPAGYRTTELQKALAHAATLGWTNAALNWVERGPGNVGGRTRPILVDPDDPKNTWWAGSVSGGLWKTTNKGSTWTPVADNLSMMSVGSLAMAESNHNIIYMGTGEGFGNIDVVDGNGIFKSTDRGVTWTHLQSTAASLDFRYVNRIVVDPSNADVVITATLRGIFRSTNGGSTWTRVSAGSVQDLRAQPGNFNRLVAGVNGQGIFYSNDAGVSWSVAPAQYPSSFGRIELAFSPSQPDTAYAAVEGTTSSPKTELLRSNDGGRTWAPTIDKASSPTNWLGYQGWYDNALAVHPFKPDTVLVGGIKLWRIRMADSVKTVTLGPTALNRGGTETWMKLTNFAGSHFDGTLDYLDSDAKDVTEADYSTIEIRFGQGSQKAHRFTVAEDAGSHGNGGSGVPLNEYQYEDYVTVPLQVWDTDNNRQLMFSFRDQADDDVFNLIPFFTSTAPGTRNQQSREYMYIHRYDYDDTDPETDIAEDGGMMNGMLYFIWPTLQPSATWDPPNLASQTMEIEFTAMTALERIVDSGISNTPHVDHHGILPIPVDNSNDKFWILNTNDGGVALSTDGGATFTEKDQARAGYNTAQFYGVAKKPGQAAYVGGTQDNGTWRSYTNPDNQDAWHFAAGGDGFEAVWHASKSNRLMGSKQFSQVLRSLNGGSSFGNSLTLSRSDGVFLTPLASSDDAPDAVYTVGARGVWRTTNFGESWSLTGISSNWNKWDGCTVRVSKADSDVVWAGCGLRSSASDRRLHVSMDKGKTFSITTEAPNVTRPPNSVVSGLATHPTSSVTAYALFSVYGKAKVLETEDTGKTWVDLSSFNSSGNSTNGFPDVAVYDLLVMDHAPTVFWVGTDIGLFESKDSGANWSYANNGLMAVPIWRMKFRDNEVIVATHGRGVWTVPSGEIKTSIAEESGTLPSEFILSQNYPNPFNVSTNIQFAVPTEGHVRLTVYDVLGRRVSVLASRVYAPGTYDLTWDADAHASGTYFYRMESDGQLVGTQKMTLLK